MSIYRKIESKTIKVWSCLALIFVLGVNHTIAQRDSVLNREDTLDLLEVNLLDYLPPLKDLIDSAINHSPEVAFYDARAKGSEYDIKIEQKRWAADIQLTAGYNWANGNQVSLGTGQTAVTDIDQQTAQTTWGAGFRMPLSTIYGRSDRINRARAVQESELHQKRLASETIRQTVIETYNALILQQKVLSITAEARESAFLIQEMSEQKFKDGDLTLEELGQVTELKAKYSIEYEQLSLEFRNTYKLLERIVGVPFSKFQK